MGLATSVEDFQGYACVHANESRDVADHAAPDTKDERLPIKARSDHSIAKSRRRA
jgi:hypothetical protein